jgi:hypothetical protein
MTLHHVFTPVNYPLRAGTVPLESKQPVIGALVAKYQKQRLDATRRRAREIVTLLREPLPVLQPPHEMCPA